MPPVWEDRRYTAKDSKSSQCDRVTDKTKKTNGKSEPLLENTNRTNGSGQPHKLAREDIGTECLETSKQPMKFNKEKDIERADYSDSSMSAESNKYGLKGLMQKDIDTYFEKINKEELKTEKEAESELQHSEDEKAGGRLDNKATTAMDVPTELESAYVYKEDTQGVNKCTKDDETRANRKDDSDDQHDHKDTADTTNESVTPEPVYDPPQATQRDHTRGEDSEVSIVEPTECNTPPVDNAKFVITVVKAPFKRQIREPTVYPPVVETKFFDYVLPNHGITYLSLNALLNDKLLDDLLSEGQLVALAGNQPLKHPENEASRPDTSDTSAFLTVEKLQVGGSVYPYFSALAGAAGESPEELSSESSEPQDCGDDDDDTTSAGSVSDHTSFQSGFSDIFDPYT